MKNLFIRALFAVMLLFCASTVVCSQDVKQLTKEHKKLIKQLKKQHNFKSVKIVVAPDGFWYFLVQNKYTEKLGVATQDGKIIIPAQYNKIEYHPAILKGYSTYPSYDGTGVNNLNLSRIKQSQAMGKIAQPLTMKDIEPYIKGEFKIYHPAAPAIFIANERKKGEVYTTDGTKLLSHTSSLDYYGGYLFGGVYQDLYSMGFERSYSKEKWYAYLTLFPEQKNIYSLYTADGVCLIKEACDIDIEPNGVCKYKIKEDGMELCGAFFLRETNNAVPCKYNDVRLKYDNTWEVKKNENSEYEAYEPGDELKQRFRDKGEEYFEKEDYDAVIEFYASEGVAAPWAKFFTGAALSSKAHTHVFRCESACIDLEENNPVVVRFKFDLSEAEKYLKLSLSLLDAYMKEDSVYFSNAKMKYSSVMETLENLPQLKIRYANAVQKQSAAAAEQIRQQQQEQALRQQAMQQMVNSISQSLQQCLAGTRTSTTHSIGSSGGNMVGVTGGGGASNVSSDDSSSSSSDNTDQLIYWERKKRDTEKLIQNTRARLAKDPGNSHIKRQLESQEELLDTCDETISRLKAKK